jgi:hypothetical protein
MDDEKYQLSANKFSGKRTDFVMWAARFMSYAHSKGFDDILYGCKNMRNPSKMMIWTNSKMQNKSYFFTMKRFSNVSFTFSLL